MFSLTDGHRYWFCTAPADMRKSFDGLSAMVSAHLKGDPCSGDVFIFLNKRKDKMKLLHWEAGGFVLYYKRLEQGTFQPPRHSGAGHRLHHWELALMVSGIVPQGVRQKKRFIQPEIVGN